MSSEDVFAKNQRTFDTFKRSFSASDTQKYFVAASKLRPWLDNEKAYYNEARPEIVKILLIAEETLQKNAANPQYKTLSEHFVAVVRVLARWQARFVEPDLQASVQRLIQVADRLDPPQVPAPPPYSVFPQVAPLQGSPPPPFTPHASSIAVQPGQQMRASSSSLASALTPTSPVASTSRVPAPVNLPPPSTKTSSGTPNPAPVAEAAQVPIEATAAAGTVDAAVIPETPNATNAASSVSAGSGSAPLPASKPKRKKRKVDLSIIQADLSQRQRGPPQKPAEDAQPKLPSLSSSVVPASLQTSPVVSTPISSKKVETTQATTESVVVPISVEPRDGLSHPHPTPPAVQDTPIPDKKSKEVEMTDSHAQPSALPESSTSTPVPLSSVMDDEVNRVLHTLTVPASLVKEVIAPVSSADPKLPDAAIEAVNLTMVGNADEAILPIGNLQRPAAPRGLSRPPDPANSSNSTDCDMDVDTPEGTPELTQTEQVTWTPMSEPPSAAALQEFIRDMVTNMNKRIYDSTASAMEMLPTPPTTVENGLEHEAGEWSVEATPPHLRLSDYSEEPPSSNKTGIKGGTVIACERGLTSGTVSIDFVINRDQFDSITKWKDRLKHSDDLGASLCITLLCFTGVDIATWLESSHQQNRDLGTLLPDLECSWPKSGGLTLDALFDDRRRTFPMSPPFALSPNGLLDMSPFLVLGKNTFSITQTRDMSQYWLVLCAHYPTRSQLNEVARRRHKEKNWTGWLETFSQPLQLPFSIPIEA
ncbi:hypothetical protein B0H16DRAFT_1514760 [Mycena metata]|uniref:Uncharacterized protein n=1 Tax=Mycena metata TaxID=1033252 RepID=A0AAD7JTW9_9AGAR|nr:hypothetical protein B0H16DRAFT_1514760 [Mycena metata]